MPCSRLYQTLAPRFQCVHLTCGGMKLYALSQRRAAISLHLRPSENVFMILSPFRIKLPLHVLYAINCNLIIY
jgi:hypothetical protein